MNNAKLIETDAWPYRVNYGKENDISVDVLVLGGGIAGCHAAISATKRGAKVAIVDKGPVIRSGSGGAGAACTGRYAGRKASEYALGVEE